MLITDKNTDLSHFHGNSPRDHGRNIHTHHPPPPPPPLGGSKARKSKNCHQPKSYPTPNHMENKVENQNILLLLLFGCDG